MRPGQGPATRSHQLRRRLLGREPCPLPVGPCAWQPPDSCGARTLPCVWLACPNLRSGWEAGSALGMWRGKAFWEKQLRTRSRGGWAGGWCFLLPPAASEAGTLCQSPSLPAPIWVVRWVVRGYKNKAGASAKVSVLVSTEMTVSSSRKAA